MLQRITWCGENLPHIWWPEVSEMKYPVWIVKKKHTGVCFSCINSTISGTANLLQSQPSTLILTCGGKKSIKLAFLGIAETTHHCHSKALSWLHNMTRVRAICVTDWASVCSSQHECYIYPYHWLALWIILLFLYISLIRPSFFEDTRKRHRVLILLSKCKLTHLRTSRSFLVTS